MPAEGRVLMLKPSSTGGWFFMARAIIFVNGILADPAAARDLIKDGDFIVAADGGLHNAQAVGVTPHALIGDFDSLTPAELTRLEKTSIQILHHPPEKDETDLELAISLVLEKLFTEIIVIGALGGRLDQTLGNIALLSDVPPDVDIRLDDGREEVVLVNNRLTITGKPGDTLSLIPWGDSVEGVITESLRYPLNDETLHSNKSRGISNVMLKDQAAIQLTRGRLIVIHSRK
jgi:thiamine pyrophosphokinase